MLMLVLMLMLMILLMLMMLMSMLFPGANSFGLRKMLSLRELKTTYAVIELLLLCPM